MRKGLEIAFLGSSLVSAHWNGAATYYRGIIRALHARVAVWGFGHDAFEKISDTEIELGFYVKGEAPSGVLLR